MIREDRFLISKRLYAVDLDVLKTHPNVRQDGSFFYGATVNAVWFRRRRGVTVAVIGTLWDYQEVEPASVVAFLAAHTDGRYGGSWTARWDGRSYVSENPASPEAMAEHLALLRPMLESFPAIPSGYDGWWRF